MHKVTRSVLALLSMFTVSCDGGGGSGGPDGGGRHLPPATYTVSGVIVTATGGPLGGATVTLDGQRSTATTDTNGNYTFKGVANGTYTLTVTADGYRFNPYALTPTGAAMVTVSGADATLNFAADGAYTISGTIARAWGGAL